MCGAQSWCLPGMMLFEAISGPEWHTPGAAGPEISERHDIS
jgi:hypothetical protein